MPPANGPLPLLFDAGPGEGKRGIAALAFGSELLDERNDVEYFDLPCRSVLNKCSARSMPFEFTINPYRGCEFGCTYCYARSTHEYLDLGTGTDFESKIFVKREAPAIVARELARAARRGRGRKRGPIAIGTATDPYQPAERRLGLTRAILEEIARHPGLSLSVTTKSDLIVRDADVLEEIARRSSLHVNITITTLDADLARTLEPRAPHPEKRVRAVAALSSRGIRAGVFCMPILPFLTDDPLALRRLLFAAAEARAHFFCAQVLFLRPGSRSAFLSWLEAYRPELMRVYENLYGSSAYAPFQVAEKIKRVVEALRRQYGLPRSPPACAPPGDGRDGVPPRLRDADEPALASPEAQLPLFARPRTA
ncbi:radical SAM protein [bacterium]|nr:radical SAM protein [bacterium]